MTPEEYAAAKLALSIDLKTLAEYFDAAEAFLEFETGDIAPAARKYEEARDRVKALRDEARNRYSYMGMRQRNTLP